jgi:TetR/AcrR family transcriptional regulator, cholesterol catabolism regulator
MASRNTTNPTARGVARSEEIIDAAVRLWARRGYDATGIADVCAEAKIGKGALYHHVNSKEDILFEIHNRFVDPMLEYGRALLSSEMAPGEALTALGHRQIATIAQNRDECAIFIREYIALSDERFRTVRAKRREFSGIVSDLISRGIAAGEFDDVPVDLATHAFLALHNHVYAWLRSDGTLTPAEVADVFDRIFLKGIKSSKDGDDGRGARKPAAAKRTRDHASAKAAKP